MWNKFAQTIQETSPLPPTSRPAPGPQQSFSANGPSRMQSGLYGSGPVPPRLTPRSSSLNLSLANTSSISLSGGLPRQASQSGLTNGLVGYKAAIASARPSEGKESLKKLGDILNSSSTEIRTTSAVLVKQKSEPDLVDLLLDDEINFEDLTLEDFVRKDVMLDEDASSRIKKPSEKSTEDYEVEKDKFEDLHRSIMACDKVLQSVESYLSAFKTDLGHVSAEIETLQNRSFALNTKLNNRRTVERLLGPIVEDVALPPSIIQGIAEGEVNDNWVRSLQEADRRIRALDRRKMQNIKAMDDMKPELERLTNSAIERVRDYFVSKIKSLRVPNTNAQVMQQTAFIRYKDLFSFMSRHHPVLADEIGQAYVNTMRWYYLSHFARYQKSLEKLKIYVIEKQDLLGSDDTPRRGNIIPGLKASAPSISDALNLSRRHEVYKNQDMTLLSTQMADEDKGYHHIEVPFRSYNFALAENVASEFIFLTDFFGHKKYDQLSKMFHQIFDPTLNAGQTFSKSLIENTYDALGVLLCVRLNQQSAYYLQRRRVPVLDNYINATNILLWPRFQVVMDMHSESLRKSVGGGLGRPSGLVNTANDLARQSAAPHPLTQKFAQFMHSLLLLSADAGDDEPSTNSLRRLRNDFEAFLTKLSTGISDKTKRERFLFNNYSLALTIISDTEGKLAMEQKGHLEALMKGFSAGLK